MIATEETSEQLTERLAELDAEAAAALAEVPELQARLACVQTELVGLRVAALEGADNAREIAAREAEAATLAGRVYLAQHKGGERAELERRRLAAQRAEGDQELRACAERYYAAVARVRAALQVAVPHQQVAHAAYLQSENLRRESYMLRPDGMPAAGYIGDVFLGPDLEPIITQLEQAEVAGRRFLFGDQDQLHNLHSDGARAT